MFDFILKVLREIFGKKEVVTVHQKTDDYDSHVVDDLALTIVRTNVNEF